MLDRRSALLAGLASIFSPARLAAQSKKAPRIGILNYASDSDIRVRQFREALRSFGLVDGQSAEIALRSADGVFDRLPTLAADLVAARVDVIIALGPATWAATRATTSIPIVIAFSGDPVGDGVVPSLARPGGNVTGFSYMSTDLAAKRLELLVSALPGAQRIGVLLNPNEPATRRELGATAEAARRLNVTLLVIEARNASELDPAFDRAVAEKVEGLIVFTHGFAVINAPHIIVLAASKRIPVLYGWHEFVSAGGFMSYGPDIESLVRGAARKVDLILKGASPAELSVEQASRLMLSINLNTARALELKIPPAILIRADETID